MQLVQGKEINHTFPQPLISQDQLFYIDSIEIQNICLQVDLEFTSTILTAILDNSVLKSTLIEEVLSNSATYLNIFINRNSYSESQCRCLRAHYQVKLENLTKFFNYLRVHQLNQLKLTVEQEATLVPLQEQEILFTLSLLSAVDETYIILSSNLFTLLKQVGYCFNGKKIKGIRLQDVDLSGSDFINADLSYSHLRRVAITGCDFTSANLSHSLWEETVAIETHQFKGVEYRILTMTCSLDSMMIAYGANDRIVRLWDIQTKGAKRMLKGHHYPVDFLVFSNDDNPLASKSTDSVVRIWDVKRGLTLRTFSINSFITTLAFGINGKVLGLASKNNSIHFHDISTNKCFRIFDSSLIGRVKALALASSCGVLATEGFGHSIQLVDVLTGKIAQQLVGHKSIILSIAYSSDHQLLASGGQDKTFCLWELRCGKQRWSRQLDNIISSVAISRDNKLAATGGQAHSIQLWVIQNGQELRRLQNEYSCSVASVIFSGTFLISLSTTDSQISIWDMGGSPTAHRQPGHELAIHSLALSETDGVFATAGSDQQVIFWNIGQGNEILRLPKVGQPIFEVTFSPDGRLLASAIGDHTIKLWNTNTQKEIGSLSGHNDFVTSLSIFDNKLASGSEDQTIRLWCISSLQEKLTLRGHKGAVLAVALFNEGNRLVSSSKDNTVRLWDVECGIELHKMLQHEDWVNCLTLSPDLKRVASGGSDHKIVIWDVESYCSTKATNEIYGRVSSLTFVNEKILAFACNKFIQFLEVDSMNVILSFKAHKDQITALGFSKSQMSLLSVSDDQTIKIWQIEWEGETQNQSSKIKSQTLLSNARYLAGLSQSNTSILIWDITAAQVKFELKSHKSRVTILDFNPDFTLLASGDADFNIKVWLVDTGAEFCTLEGHESKIDFIGFSSDGRQLVSRSKDNTVCLWDLSTGAKIECIKLSSVHETKGLIEQVLRSAAIESSNYSSATQSTPRIKWNLFRTIQLDRSLNFTSSKQEAAKILNRHFSLSIIEV